MIKIVLVFQFFPQLLGAVVQKACSCRLVGVSSIHTIQHNFLSLEVPSINFLSFQVCADSSGEALAPKLCSLLRLRVR